MGIILVAPLPFAMVEIFRGGDFEWILVGWIAPWALLFFVFSAIEDIQKKVIYYGRRGISTFFYWGTLPFNSRLSCSELRQSEHPVAFFVDIAFRLMMAMVILFYIGLELRIKFGIGIL